MPKMTIDGVEIEVPAGITVLQACELAGREIPRFCYHERLSIAGNCRMCLVEQEKAPKPIASCAMPVAEGMVIKTDTPVVQKARKGVMEFLLINHPLDCPICDQGGECDLQDQAMGYGFDKSRYHENKRAVPDKNLGPLIKTSMNRCIHCTRCIRFATEVAGVEELGATGRGEHMEVTNYVSRALTSEMSGNMIDLCPVGALTSKPYEFAARPWELRKTESIDVLDAVGSNIRIDARGAEVMRVLPRLHEEINEEWISDKTRFACDGLKRQRLDRPYIRRNGKLEPATWGDALTAVAWKLRGASADRVAALSGDLADVEAQYALKELLAGMGVRNIDCRQDGAKLDPSNRAGYLFNSTIAGIDQADVILLVGTDPRHEAPIVNSRIRRRWLTGALTVASIGPLANPTYGVTALGMSPAMLQNLGGFADKLKNAKNPMIIVGMGALTREDGAAVLAQARQVAEACNVVREGWNGFNVLHTAGGRVGGLDVGFVPGEGGRDRDGILAAAQAGEMDVIYLLGADEIDMAKLGKAFVVYQGHHGDAGAHRADVVLPGAAYTEKDAIYVNTEGRVQLARRAVQPPGEAREDWAIVRALSEVINNKLPFDTLAQLRAGLVAANPVFAGIDRIKSAAWGSFGAQGAVADRPFATTVRNFYMTDPISRASPTMARCTAEILGGQTLAAAE
ncbi:MAG: NADH-quinone oxidoreductase subunit [Alphaproteobacteria bacterium]|nr:NADH-quinone oxidoreductase subunit [Alphaproteobacteria bacterium]